MSSKEQADDHWWIGYCYTINGIIGAGILAIPWAYYTSGWVLGAVCQLFTLIVSISSSYLYLSAWSRMDTLASIQNKEIKYKKVTIKQAFQRPKTEDNDEHLLTSNIQKPIIGKKKYDLYEMITITMGKNVGKLVIISFILGAYPNLIAYISVFSVSLASNIPIFGYTCNLYEESDFFGECKILYWTYLSIFSIFQISLSCFHIREHQWLQVPLTLLRFLVIGIMIITSSYSYFTETGLGSTKPFSPAPELFNLNNLSRVFFIIMFSSLYEYYIPTATGFVKNKSEHLKKLINSVIITFHSVYLILGLVLCSTIENPGEMVNLSWRNYSAGNSLEDRKWWTYIIEYLIILLPAFDIATSFPIIANSFADNLMSIKYGHKEKHMLNSVIFMQSIEFGYRMIVIIPSVVVAIFIYDLGSILEFAGIFSLVLSGILIPLVALAATRLIKEKSDYDFFDNFLVAVFLISVSTILLLFSVCSSILNTLS